VQEAIAVYSSDELDTDQGNGGDNNVHLKDWLVEGKKQLELAREALRYLYDPVDSGPARKDARTGARDTPPMWKSNRSERRRVRNDPVNK
jgi:hypothetical protein